MDEEGYTTFLLREGSITVKNIYDNSELILSPGYKVLSVNKTVSVPEELTKKDFDMFNTDYRNGVSGFLFAGIGASAVVFLVLVLILLKKRK